MAGTDCRLEVLRSGCWNMESCPGCSLPHFPDPPCCWPLITALTGHWADSCENYRDILLMRCTSGCTSQITRLSGVTVGRAAARWGLEIWTRGGCCCQLLCGEAPCHEDPHRPAAAPPPPATLTLTRGGDTH